MNIFKFIACAFSVLCTYVIAFDVHDLITKFDENRTVDIYDVINILFIFCSLLYSMIYFWS